LTGSRFRICHEETMANVTAVWTGATADWNTAADWSYARK